MVSPEPAPPPPVVKIISANAGMKTAPLPPLPPAPTMTTLTLPATIFDGTTKQPLSVNTVVRSAMHGEQQFAQPELHGKAEEQLELSTLLPFEQSALLSHPLQPLQAQQLHL